MEILEKIQERNVTDYDFMFVSGQKMSITLDFGVGDTFEELEDRYRLFVEAKPSFLGQEPTEAETVQVFKNHLAMLASSSRTVRIPTEEESFEMQQTLHKLAKGIQ